MSDVLLSEPTTTDEGPLLATMACASCGSPIEREDRFCPACGTAIPTTAPPVVAELAELAELAETSEPPAAPMQRRFACKNCGAEVAVDPDRRSYTCAFCDSNYVVELPEARTGRQPPEFVIGFAVTPKQAHERFRRWIAENSFFRPGDLHRAKVEEKLTGVYLPFWSFSMLARSGWTARIGEYWYRTETYTTTQNGKTVTKTRRVRETEWWNLAGRHHRYYSGYLVSGSRGLAQSDADRVAPFHLAALRRYEPHYLAGWLGEEYSIGRDAALEICHQEFARREQSNVADHLPGDTHRNLQVNTRWSDASSDLILLPVYLLSYRHGEKLYRFMINGQTGKTVGYKPWSWLKIGLTAAAIVAMVVALIVAAAVASL